MRERVVNDLPVGVNYLLKAGSSGAIYTAVLLTIAYLFSATESFRFGSFCIFMDSFKNGPF